MKIIEKLAELFATYNLQDKYKVQLDKLSELGIANKPIQDLSPQLFSELQTIFKKFELPSSILQNFEKYAEFHLELKEPKSMPNELVLHPAQDKFSQAGLSWLRKTGSKEPITIKEIIRDFSGIHEEKSEVVLSQFSKMHDLLYAVSCAYLPKKFEDKTEISYGTLSLLDTTQAVNKRKKSMTCYEIIKFYGHLTSVSFDLMASILPEDRLNYCKLGFVNQFGESTPLFRETPLGQIPDLVQKRLDGMNPIVPLILMQHILEIIANIPHYRSKTIASQLIPHLQRTTYLKDIEENMYNAKQPNVSFTDLATKLIMLRTGYSESFMLHSGHFQHTFYVNVYAAVSRETIKVEFVIHNFNFTAKRFNQRHIPDENSFYPFVLRLTTGRLKDKQRAKKINDLQSEIETVSFYLRTLIQTHREGGFYQKQTAMPMLSKKQHNYLDRFKNKVGKYRDAILGHIRPQMLDDNGRFSLAKMRQVLGNWDSIVDILNHIENFWGSIDEPTLKGCFPYIQESLQTIILVDIVYLPHLYGMPLLQNITAPDDIAQYRPYALQHVGNCTVHNMKSALYALANLDWRQKENYQRLLNLNFDINYQLILLFLGRYPDIHTHYDRSKILPPFPRCIIEDELSKAKRHMDAKEFLQAKAVLELAIKKDPDNAIAYGNLALVHEELQDWASAFHCYNEAIDRLEDFTLLTNRAILLMDKMGKQQEALTDFAHSVECNPYAVNTYYNRAVLYHKIRDESKFIADVDRMIELEPENLDNYLFKGQALLDFRKMIDGIVCVNRAYELGLRSHNLFFTGFKLNYFAGKLSEAQKNHQDMLAADSHHPENKNATTMLKSLAAKKILFWYRKKRDEKLTLNLIKDKDHSPLAKAILSRRRQ